MSIFAYKNYFSFDDFRIFQSNYLILMKFFPFSQDLDDHAVKMLNEEKMSIHVLKINVFLFSKIIEFKNI